MTSRIPPVSSFARQAHTDEAGRDAVFGEDMNDHWLIIGGGPLAQEHAECARVSDGWKPVTVIGCNRAIEFAKLDLYWLSDPTAIVRFKPFWERFDGEVISNDEVVAATRAGRRTTKYPYMLKGQIFHGRCSGVLCCRVAISRNATRLTLVGFQGYDPEDWIPDASGKPFAKRGEQALKVNEAQAAAFADIAKSHPDVAVTVYGPTRIRMPKTWRVV